MQVVGVKQLMKLTKRKLSHPEAETEDVAPSANRQHLEPEEGALRPTSGSGSTSELEGAPAVALE